MRDVTFARCQCTQVGGQCGTAADDAQRVARSLEASHVHQRLLVWTRRQDTADLLELRGGEWAVALGECAFDRAADGSNAGLIEGRQQWWTTFYMTGAMTTRTALIPVVLFTVAAAHAGAQTPPTPAGGSIDVARTVESLVGVVRSTYIDADTAEMIAQHILERFHSGSYDDVPSPDSLARRLTRDLRSINGDLHLAVMTQFPPPAQRPGAAPNEAPRGPYAATGIDSLRILDGNIGYIAIGRMPPPSSAADSALQSAMHAVKDVDGLIIDVRGNRGGAPTTGDALWTYLAAAPDQDSIPTLHRQGRGKPSTQRWSRRVEGPRPGPGIPLFILTSSGTGSAAEGFTFFLQQSGRARVVGESTAGAGHLAIPAPIGSGMTLLISVERVTYGSEGKEWERTGVIPDVPVSAGEALERAYALARAQVLQPNR